MKRLWNILFYLLFCFTVSTCDFFFPISLSSFLYYTITDHIFRIRNISPSTHQGIFISKHNMQQQKNPARPFSEGEIFRGFRSNPTESESADGWQIHIKPGCNFANSLHKWTEVALLFQLLNLSHQWLLSNIDHSFWIENHYRDETEFDNYKSFLCLEVIIIILTSRNQISEPKIVFICSTETMNFKWNLLT